MSKRVISFLLCLCMLVTTFVGCSNNKPATATATEQRIGEQWLGEQMLLYPNAKIAFRIIRDQEATPEVIGYAGKIKSEIKERLDITAEYKPDTVVEKEGLIEVCVGETNRDGYKEIYDEIVNYREMHDYDWTIQMVGKKIFIVGGSNVALEFAVDYFIEMFCSTLGTIITSEYCYKYKYEFSDSFSINGENKLDSYKIVMPKYNLSYIVGRELDGLADSIKRYNGSEIEIVTDREKASDKEIIISDFTDRGGVANLTDRDDWQITVKGNNVYIEGGHNYSNAIAVSELAKYVKEGKKLKDGDVIKGKYSETIKKYDEETYYRLTLKDEFDESYDETIWECPHEDYPPEAELAYGFNGKMRPENTYIEDGKFVGFNSYDASEKMFYGARLTTENKVWFKYGFVEMSVVIPSGPSFWSSFWLLGPTGREHVEVDIFEQFSIGDCIKSTLHCYGNDLAMGAAMSLFEKNTMEDQHQKSWYFLPEGEDFSDTFHTVGYEWDEEGCRFTMDGRVFYEVDYYANETVAKAFQQYHRVRIGVGGGRAGVPATGDIGMARPAKNEPETELIQSVLCADINDDCWTETNKYIIEYFHLYQTAGQGIKYR